MSELFSSGRIADIVLAVLVLEGAALAVLGRRGPRVPPLGAALPFLVAGGFFALALRGALVGARWEWIAAALLGALGAHLADLARR